MADISSWRCDHCDKLIYNVDENGYPVPGAPMPLYLNNVWKNVCDLCYDMGRIIRDRTYWKALHDKWLEPKGTS